MRSTTSRRSTSSAWSVWRRPNASSWRVRSLARTAASRIAATFSLRGVAALELALQQVAVADHRGHQVVEVVRDPAGELADRLHLLRLAQLLLELDGVR